MFKEAAKELHDKLTNKNIKRSYEDELVAYMLERDPEFREYIMNTQPELLELLYS